MIKRALLGCCISSIFFFDAQSVMAGTVRLEYDLNLFEGSGGTFTVEPPRRLTPIHLDIQGLLTIQAGFVQPNTQYRSSLIGLNRNLGTATTRAVAGSSRIAEGKGISSSVSLLTAPDLPLQFYVEDSATHVQTGFQGRATITFESPTKQDIILRFPEASDTTPFKIALIEETTNKLVPTTVQFSALGGLTSATKEDIRRRVQEIFDETGANVDFFIEGDSADADPDALVVSLLESGDLHTMPPGYRLSADPEQVYINARTNGIARIRDEVPSALVFARAVADEFPDDLTRIADVIAHEAAHLVLVGDTHFSEGGIMEASQNDNLERRFMPTAAAQLLRSVGGNGELFLPDLATVQLAGSWVSPGNVAQIESFGLMHLMTGSSNQAFWEITDLDWTYGETVNLRIPEFEGLGALLGSTNGSEYDFVFMPSGATLPLSEWSVADFAAVTFAEFLAGGFETDVSELSAVGLTSFGTAFVSSKSAGVEDDPSVTPTTPVPVPSALIFLLTGCGVFAGMRSIGRPRRTRSSME